MEHADINREDAMVHRLKNQLTIVIGFSELLLEDMANTDPKRQHVVEIHMAASNALATMPELARRLVTGKTDD